MSCLAIACSAVLIIFSHTPPFQYLFVLVLALIQAAALNEFYALSENKGFKPVKKLAIAASIAYFFLHYASGSDHIIVPFLLLTMGCAFIAHFAKHKDSIPNLAITLFGLLYITIPLSFLVDINFLGSSIWFVYLLITTKMTDTAAYCTGKLFGSHLLAPTLSPKKTVEGAIGGLFGTCIASVAFAYYFPNTIGISLIEALLLGVLISIVAQVGDLAESLLKRDAEVKDSSTLPGFGGMLDVVDSLIFTTPLLYFWLWICI